MTNIYDKYLNSNEDVSSLKRFSFAGKADDLNRKLHYLTTITDPEQWYFDQKNGEKFSIIFYYVTHTFDRCLNQEKIIIDSSEQFACFNTGLLDSQGNEIYGIFTKSTTFSLEDKRTNYWYLKGFFKENERFFNDTGLRKPPLATYYTDYNSLYFNPCLDISVNFDHIYNDNFERLPIALKQLEIDLARQVFEGFLSHTKKKIHRNDRIPVPQFYRDKIMFLIPIKILGEIMVIAVEKFDQQYLANTVLNFEMAYNCARLLNKPESNWLLPSKI